MTSSLSEDDIYRTSTQYRLWSFSPEQLAAQRRKTHGLAIARAQQHSPDSEPEEEDGKTNGHVEYLTEEEELRLVQRYCELIRTTSEHLKWPVNIKATAVQYLKRFYLTNSCMTYPPKEIYKTVSFMATKTEAYHWTVNKFAQSISGNAEAILAPEYKVIQALRYTLDVRQPFRGLKGVLMELLNMAEGRIGAVSGVDQTSGDEIQQSLLSVPAPSESCRSSWKMPAGSMDKPHLIKRIQTAYETARVILDAPASVTDAYFLYTPSQILLAAMHIADEPLTAAYLDTKLDPSSPTRSKILATIQSCAALLAAYSSKNMMTKDEREALEKKLERCRDPTTRDLTLTREDLIKKAQTQGTKRKAERAKSKKEMDDLFGPTLDKSSGKG